ncbi:hypothetical protein TSEDIMI_90128 [Tenacibaculum sediminilitoris]|uniref:hypothetical protein n=1 Tax=Tenacibaculum sediminilitoris TaxID=1820334 RepID=UPI003895DEB9
MEELHLSIQLKLDSLHATILDNGIGLNAAKNKKPLGISIVKEHLKLMYGKEVKNILTVFLMKKIRELRFS